MDMQHGRLIPAAAAIAVGVASMGGFLAVAGLDADIGNSALLLAMTVAVFIVPGCIGVACMSLRARYGVRSAAPAVTNVAPFPAAEAVADVHSFVEARVERRNRNRRIAASAAPRSIAMS
jgi:hypothetical protein